MDSALLQASDLVTGRVLERNLDYCLTCLCAFAQGAPVSNELILQGQYMKAAAAVKQDVELLAQFYEVVEGRAKPRKTPNVKSDAVDMGRMYGALNKIAHPSNFSEMHSVLSSARGDMPIHPVRIEQTEVSLSKMHAWICVQFAIAAIELLELVADGEQGNDFEKIYESFRNGLDGLAESSKFLYGG